MTYEFERFSIYEKLTGLKYFRVYYSEFYNNYILDIMFKLGRRVSTNLIPGKNIEFIFNELQKEIEREKSLNAPERIGNLDILIPLVATVPNLRLKYGNLIIDDPSFTHHVSERERMIYFMMLLHPNLSSLFPSF